jgi:hypothetical protein
VNRFDLRKGAFSLLVVGTAAFILSMGLSNAHEYSHSIPEFGDTRVGHEDGVGDHEHGTIEVSNGQAIPTVDLIVHPDVRRGWNLEIQVTNFRFAPEHVNQSSTPTEGHAHLYIDGEKITRLYGNWYYLESLPPGQREITVGLSANGHEALTMNGQPIQATVRIDVP